MKLDRHRRELALLALILLVAATIRLWRLDSVPPGLTHDEAGHAQDAIAILDGARPIFQRVGYGREPLYDYMVAGMMGVLGPTSSTLRLSSVLLGLATLLLTYAWVRVVFDAPTALATLVLLAASFWSLSTSRQALRSGLLPVLFTGAVYVYWRVYQLVEPPSGWLRGSFPILLGATFYTYIPARVLWTLFPAFLVYLTLCHRNAFRRVGRFTLLAVAVALLLAAPLFAYLRAHPDAEQRLEMLDEPLDALRRGDLTVLLERAASALGGLLLPGRGDDFLAYTIPGRPVFTGLIGALFLVGLGLGLSRWRDPAYAFALLWLFIGLSPSLITGATASTTRGIGALPVVFLFPALAVVAAARWAASRWGSRVAQAVGAGFVCLVLVTGARSARDYLVTWGGSPDVRAAYLHTLVEMAGYVARQPEAGGVALSSIHPLAPHDPYVFDLALRRRDLNFRWFDARRALLLPQEPFGQLLTPSSAPLNPYFADLPGLHQRERVTLQPNDLDPFFLRYDWDSRRTLRALRERANGVPLDLASPVEFGDALQLLGHDLRTPSLLPGGTVELVTLWQVTDASLLQPQDLALVDAELALFTHALDANRRVVGQEDRLDAPAWDWQGGDTIAQIHRFPLESGVAAGAVSLEVGVYRRADLTRLPVLVEGAVVGDSVCLGTVKVVGP